MNKQTRSRNSRGFTLLELLVALAVFALIAALAYGGLSGVLQSEAELSRRAGELADAQRAFLFLGRDVQQQIDRPIRDEFGDARAALLGSKSALEFTCAGWSNPLGRRRSGLQRVAYALEGDTLYRLHWNVLDRAQDSQPVRAALLAGVDEFSLRYLDGGLVWHDAWPLPQENPGGAGTIAQLKAVEITLRLPAWGELTRLYAVPQAFAPPLPEPETPPPPGKDQPPVEQTPPASAPKP